MNQVFFGKFNPCSHRVNICVLQVAISADGELKLFNVQVQFLMQLLMSQEYWPSLPYRPPCRSSSCRRRTSISRSSPTSATVTSGRSVTSTVTITPAGGFQSTTSLTCSGLPAKATCSFSPASATPSSGTAISSMTIQTGISPSLQSAVEGISSNAAAFAALPPAA